MNWKKESTRFAKFLVVGTIGFVIDFTVLNLLTAVWSLDANIAQTVSFLAAVLSNFVWNRYWTYPDSRSKPVAWQLFQFTAINVMGWLIRSQIFIYMTPVWQSAVGLMPGRLPFSDRQVALNLTLGCAVIVVLIWNFAINRLWTYNDVR